MLFKTKQKKLALKQRKVNVEIFKGVWHFKSGNNKSFMFGFASADEVHLGLVDKTRHFCSPKHTELDSPSVVPCWEAVPGYKLWRRK